MTTHAGKIAFVVIVGVQNIEEFLKYILTSIRISVKRHFLYTNVSFNMVSFFILARSLRLFVSHKGTPHLSKISLSRIAQTSKTRFEMVDNKWSFCNHPRSNVVWTCLYGKQFMVLTDTRLLKWLLSKAKPSWRLEKWAFKLQKYDIKIGYKAGKSNQKKRESKFWLFEPYPDQDHRSYYPLRNVIGCKIHGVMIHIW